MRLASYLVDGQPRAGVVASDQTLVAVSDVVAGGPSAMLAVLAAGPSLWDRLRATATSARGGQALSSARLVAPIPRPRRNLFCVGWNYSEHFAEGQGMRGPNDSPQDLPEYPALFSKQRNTVVGPEAPIWHPAPVSNELDWEVELALIVGTPGRDISEDEAHEHVFGYTVGNDVSVRDVQRRHGGQWFKGKSFDSHAPLGPWIVSADELGDPQCMHITFRAYGCTKQASTTRYMVYYTQRYILSLSTGVI